MSRYAAIGTDGLRPVVWGVGSTARRALLDAHEQEGVGRLLHDGLGAELVVQIAPEQARRRAAREGTINP